MRHHNWKGNAKTVPPLVSGRDTGHSCTHRPRLQTSLYRLTENTTCSSTEPWHCTVITIWHMRNCNAIVQRMAQLCGLNHIYLLACTLRTMQSSNHNKSTALKKEKEKTIAATVPLLSWGAICIWGGFSCCNVVMWANRSAATVTALHISSLRKGYKCTL